MELSQFFFTLFSIVFLCLGLRIVSNEGMLLYYLRMPFDSLPEEIEESERTITNMIHVGVEEKRIFKAQDLLLWMKIKQYIGKPFIMCITCMASLWGVITWISFNGFYVEHLDYMLICILSASFIQTFLWTLYAKINL